MTENSSFASSFNMLIDKNGDALVSGTSGSAKKEAAPDVVDQLACVPLEKDFGDLVSALKVQDIAENFQKNYKKLGNLKAFRSDYEEQNFLKRWWHEDTLRDAQLDSAEVQAEFSKTVGQLIIISIMQSKRLAEQQSQLNVQQRKLNSQADGIVAHADELQQQHRALAEQSERLENLVREYFALKGLTEEGAQKLIEIAREVKATKDVMLQEFESRSKNVEVLCADVKLLMEAVSAQVNEQIRLSEEQTQARIAGVRRETHDALTAHEASLREHQSASLNALNQGMKKLAESQREAEYDLQSKHSALESRFSDLSVKHDQQLAAHQERIGAIGGSVEGLSARSSDLAIAITGANAGLNSCIEQQQTHQDAVAVFQKRISDSHIRLQYLTAGLSVAVLCLLGAVAHLIRLT